MADHPEAAIAILGMKAKAQLQRDSRDNFVVTFDSIAKNLPTWNEAALVADEILKSGVEFDTAQVIYNRFKSVIAFETVKTPVHSYKALVESRKLRLE